MTPNRLAAIAFRWSISAVLTLCVFAPNAKAQSAATAINGVYNGTYTCALGPRTLKLSLLASGNGSLTGVFTFYLPPTSHTEAFSYSLSGTFDAASGKFKLDPVKWEVPPPGSYSMVGMDGAFDPGTGQVAGKITFGNCGAFQATRDQAGSANSASVIAPQKVAGAVQPPPKTAATPPARQIPTAASTPGGATGSSASVVQNSAPLTARPTPPAPQSPTSLAAPTSKENKPACQLIPKSSVESILGFQYSDPKIVPADEHVVSQLTLGINASSSCQYVTAPEDKSGVTLTIWYTENLDPDSAKDNLLNYLARRFMLRHDVTGPGFPYPAVFTNDGTYVFKGGTNGLTILLIRSYVPLDVTNGEEVHVDREKKIASKILGLPQPPQSLAASASKAAAAPPTATEGIVRRPKAYWEAYRSELIEHVFDGNFTGDLLSNPQFRILFASYVEKFSESCHAYLPARHEAVTVTQTNEKRDRNGNVISQQVLQSYTVDVDSRFVPKYREYSGSASSMGLSLALGVMSGGVSQSAFFAPGTDMIKFFKTETCQSAVMHQLGENLLRAAEKRLSVQNGGDATHVRVCVPANLVENHSWKIPPPGGKMEAFKNAVGKIVREEARSKGLDDPLFMVVERPANGSADLFDTFDPATTDPRRLVEFGGAGSGAHCPIGWYGFKLPINP